ncbi:Conserved_hypothetical protein [Hexamita inflata]|uniref:Uncharacterized protein n=1 Tax=Hexamita inflata TaxID=28002 RepID=A0AA86V6T5_9EUKA|nr:Conserved hypothetical protein [Hexamita inflata]
MYSIIITLQTIYNPNNIQYYNITKILFLIKYYQRILKIKPLHLRFSKRKKIMVLPEELVNYVKDQLLNDAPVANIIADVKSKGYQISSSTIYKIRANIVPQRPELPLPLVVPEIRQQVQVPQEEQKPQTPAWNFMPVEEPPIAGILIASMDIQETKVLLQMSKNEQNILGRQYQLNNCFSKYAVEDQLS